MIRSGKNCCLAGVYNALALYTLYSLQLFQMGESLPTFPATPYDSVRDIGMNTPKCNDFLASPYFPTFFRTHDDCQ